MGFKAFLNGVVKAVSWVASQVATTFNRIDTQITCGTLGWIGRNTLGRMYQFGNWIYDKIVPPKITKDLTPYGMKMNEIIINAQIRTTWIGNKTNSNWTKIGSLATCVLNGMLVKHWWLVVQTQQCSIPDCKTHPNIWYHFGFNKQNGLKGAIRFRRYDSYELADQFGQKSGGNTHEKPSTLKKKLTQTPISRAVEFAEKFDGRYCLATNNCQIFAQGLYNAL